MRIVRAPLRITLAGGGTDIPSWYKDNGSSFISAAIDKYIYVTYHRSDFDKKIRCRYSIMEEVTEVKDIKNEILRESFDYFDLTGGLEITSHADIPSGTGLGSSGTFGVAVAQAVTGISDHVQLAMKSTIIQMDRLQMPIGVQDQYVAAFGGIRKYMVSRTGKVSISENLKFDHQDLLSKLVLFYTGYKREANKILASSTHNGLTWIQSLGHKIEKALLEHNFDEFGRLLDKHWQYKKKRNSDMSNSEIDGWYNRALEYGALGGKLIGAGGGGFLLFYTNNREELINNMPLLHVPFNWDMEGSKVIYEY